MSIVSLIALVLLITSFVWSAIYREMSAQLLAIWAIAIVVVLSGVASLSGLIVLR